jgi:hypothetical protein
MATLRSTGTALLSTVATTANAAVRLVNAVDGVTQYGDNWMRATLREQEINLALDSETSTERAIIKSSQRGAELDLEIKSFCALSPDHERLFLSHQERLRAVAASVLRK